jgi:RsiW-degrading membrane proteinase PrsW (M82 family)
MCFGMTGLVEETLKYLPVAYARRRGTDAQRKRRDRAYIDYALAGALSFGKYENIGFLYAACKTGHESWAKLCLTVFERVIVGSTGHLLVAALTALRSIRRDYYGEKLSWWGVVGPSVMLHGAFNFVAMAFSTLEGNVGWIHPTGVWNTSAMIGINTGLVALTGWQVGRECKAIEDRDRQRK